MALTCRVEEPSTASLADLIPLTAKPALLPKTDIIRHQKAYHWSDSSRNAELEDMGYLPALRRCIVLNIVIGIIVFAAFWALAI